MTERLETMSACPICGGVMTPGREHDCIVDMRKRLLRVRMLRGRKLVHLAIPSGSGRGGGIACSEDAWVGFDLDGPYRNAEAVPDDEPLTCKRCQRIEAKR